MGQFLFNHEPFFFLLVKKLDTKGQTDSNTRALIGRFLFNYEPFSSCQ